MRGVARPSSNGIRKARSSADVHEGEEADNAAYDDNGDLFQAAGHPLREARTPAGNEDDAAVEQAINEVLSTDCERSVMALKHVEQEIQAVAPALVRHADQLAIVFGKQLHRAFTAEQSAANDRLKKHLLVTGTSIFDNTRLWDDPKARSAEDQGKTLGSFISRPALVSLLTELLQRLIETSGATDEETQTYGRYLNIIVLRSFSSCNLNVLFGACLTMLTEATEDMTELHGAILKKRSKFAELITKCLWKITRKLPASLQEDLLEPQQLLVDVEMFLQATPPNEWKRRAAEDVPLGEMPLRTIRVILTHLGSIYGEESLGMLDGLPDPEQSHVYTYLLKIFDRGGQASSGSAGAEEVDFSPIRPSSGRVQSSGGASDMAGSSRSQVSKRQAAASSQPNSPALNSTSSPFVTGTRSSASSYMDAGHANGGREEEGDPDAEVIAEVKAIFERISSKSEARAAIRDLYHFQRKHPDKDAYVQSSLEKTGPIFQKFIKRALANHAAEDEDNSLVSTPQARTLSMISGYGQSEVGTPGSVSARSSYAGPDATQTPQPSQSQSQAQQPQPGQMSQRTSFRSSIGAESANNAPASPGSQRNSVTDDRLAQLRAKFSRTPSNTSTGAGAGVASSVENSPKMAPMSPSIHAQQPRSAAGSGAATNRSIPRPVSRIPGAAGNANQAASSAALRAKLAALRAAGDAA